MGKSQVKSGSDRRGSDPSSTTKRATRAFDMWQASKSERATVSLQFVRLTTSCVCSKPKLTQSRFLHLKSWIAEAPTWYHKCILNSEAWLELGVKWCQLVWTIQDHLHPSGSWSSFGCGDLDRNIPDSQLLQQVGSWIQVQSEITGTVLESWTLQKKAPGTWDVYCTCGFRGFRGLECSSSCWMELASHAEDRRESSGKSENEGLTKILTLQIEFKHFEFWRYFKMVGSTSAS